MMIDTESILLKPHFYALIITGFIIFLIIVVIIKNYKKFLKLQFVSIILLLALTGNLVANHANLHYVLEKDYDYNPLKSTYKYFST